MKKIYILGGLFFLTLTSMSQSVFLDNLKNSVWLSDSSIIGSNISNESMFGLESLNVPKHHIKHSKTIWSFKDSLTITRYAPLTKSEVLIGKYKYTKKDGYLIIEFNEERNQYSIGITSIGNFVLLTKKKNKAK